MSILTDHVLDNLRLRLPGALDGVLRQELFFTVDELCRTAFIHRHTETITLSSGVSVYTVAPPGLIVSVASVAHLTLPVDDVIYDETQTAAGVQLSIGTEPGPEHINTPLYVELVLAPFETTPVDVDALLPDDLWRRWHEVIKDGVLGRLMSQQAKPYSNVQMAAYHMKRFRNGMASARHLTNTGHAIGAQTWSFPKWA